MVFFDVKKRWHIGCIKTLLVKLSRNTTDYSQAKPGMQSPRMELDPTFLERAINHFFFVVKITRFCIVSIGEIDREAAPGKGNYQPNDDELKVKKSKTHF